MSFSKKIFITLGLLLSYNSYSLPLCRGEFNSLSPNIRTEIHKSAIENNIDFNFVFASGDKNPDSKIGCYMPSAKAYEVFRPMVNNIAMSYHKHKINGEQKSNFDVSHLQSRNPDPKGEYIVSSRVRVARNIARYPFPSSISKSQRKALEKEVFFLLKDFSGDLRGKYFSLENMTNGEKEELIANHMLFEIEDKFLESAGISRDMPSGRGIFISNDKQFMIWLNEEDHFRIMSLNQGSNLLSAFSKVSKALSLLEKKLTFAFDKELGYLSSCPTNIGTTMRASVHIRLTNLSQRVDFKDLCASLGLQIRGTNGENSKSNNAIFDISNMQRLGKSEAELLEQLISGIEKLINLEKSLEANVEKPSIH